MSKKSLPSSARRSHEAAARWRDVVLGTLRSLPAGPARLAVIYEAVEARPEANGRAKSNAHVRPKVRQVLQQLGTDSLVEHVEKGVWQLKTS